MIFAEAVTLAHVGRPIALARMLRSLGHDVCIAAASAADRWLVGEEVTRERIESIAPETFLRALARGLPAYDAGTLKRYVEDDLRAIASWHPDIVIGDFRLSLYISARKAGKPYGAIANAYWSRRYWTGVDAPPIAPLRWLPRKVANAAFHAIYPTAFALHTLPFRAACRFFGVAPLKGDIREIYTASDSTAFADVEAFYEPTGRARTATFIGPLLWEPRDIPPLPNFPKGRPLVFVSLGSSGSTHVLQNILAALERLPIRCIAAVGGNASTIEMPGNCVHMADIVRYSEGCQAASLVVCNGGAPSMYAAIEQGRPVVAVAGNLDQLLNARCLERLGAGHLAEARPCAGNGAQNLVKRMLEEPSYAAAARKAAHEFPSASTQESLIGTWMRNLGVPA